MILISCVVKQRRTFFGQTVRLKKADVLKEKSSGDVFPLLSRGGRHRLVFSLFAIDFDVHLFARSVHTEEGVSSSTRDFIHLSF